ncbi:hypothetical protein [Parendozoicomonas haliclonae]|nr:hypothetical protein [Parendozoicomonas haliclonae]
MVEEVAEKVADRTAERVSDKMRLEMMEMETRMRTEISKDIDAKLKEFLGMSPTDHAVQHGKLDQLVKFAESTTTAVWKKVAVGVFVLVLAATSSLNPFNMPGLPPKNTDKAQKQQQ